MAASTSQGASLLRGWRKATRFTNGLGAQLPEAYRKFWIEWKTQQPAAVHYIPKEGRFERDEKSGLIKPIQNIKIPLMKVAEEVI